MIYLASPYSHADDQVKQKRFEAVCRIAAQLMSDGETVFSPIAHTHPIALAGELPGGWQYWERYDREMIEMIAGGGGKVVVVMLEGWETSKGVAAECKIARLMGMKVEYLAPNRATETNADLLAACRAVLARGCDAEAQQMVRAAIAKADATDAQRDR